ncbi:MAG: isoleucine--tRNA ligase [Coriobacteriales bacterium]|jgi:isoleucyl-tRNA synthetase|nr:isoleucine--tRNA ligase [Coriobacteriales bacterium]
MPKAAGHQTCSCPALASAIPMKGLVVANDYKQTMNLPETDFPMRAGLPVSEPKRLAKWYAEDLYQKMLDKNQGNPAFILHDGPPYANGPIHMGHAFNKILKDIIIKYHNAKGFYSPYVPGWDCHGQPIEHMVETALGPEKMASIDQVTLRRLCWEWADTNIELQREGFKRLGVLGDWDNPYLTFLPAYEAANVRVFKSIYEQGAIYRGRKPIHWCRHCHTALAEAEIEYADEPSPSIYVAFDLVDPEALLPQDLLPNSTPVRLMIWTTTPWTLPANVAVCLAPEADYVVVEANGAAYLLAESLVTSVATAVGWTSYQLAQLHDGTDFKVKGSQLSGLVYHHPINNSLTGLVLTADHVDLSTGTGAVHTAPGHGQEDYLVGEQYNLRMLMPVDDNGVFDAGGGPFAGMDVDQADPKIIEWLAAQGLLVAASTISHSYPHCWRCHQPVIFRATEQWFVSMEKTGLREKALAELQSLTWYPDWAYNRLSSMVETRPDWCISRQRAWGVPIPVYRCQACNSTVATTKTFDAVIALFEAEGADAWFVRDPAEYLPADTHCEQCGAGLNLIERERDILDVWWESGVSHTSVLEARPELTRPASMYLEGSDQHRGWFQSSLLTSVGAYGTAPYESVMSCGFVVDEQGRKMSKSLGNGVEPEEVFEKYGADVLRLWVGSVDNSQDVSISENIIDQLADAYRRIRNTFRFLISNLSDYDNVKDRVSWQDLPVIDRWALARLTALIEAIDEAYAANRFHVVYRAVYDYIVTDLSAVYLDAIKDRLYSDAPKSIGRRSAQLVLENILETLVRQLAPILSFTCDEVWEFYPKGMRYPGRPDSVMLAGWPLLSDYAPQVPVEEAKKLLADFKTVLAVRDTVTKALETARVEKLIGKSQEAQVIIRLDDSAYAILDSLPNGTLEELLIVAEVILEHQTAATTEVIIEVAAGTKCPRCWNVRQLGLDEAHPEVCVRCAEVLTELGV